jgi:hypothetical protein
MRIHQLGDGTPEVAVVAAIHGDEPCGVRAVDRLISEELDVERPVKLVVANEEALERGVRYVDEDLNRAFPGDPEAETHERRLAAELARELRGCTTLALHSTQSYGEPFALVDTVDEIARAICPHLPVEIVVETDRFTDGRLIKHPHTVEVECGFQGSDEAAENAYWLVRAFLAATGAATAPLSDEPLDAGDREEVSVYRLLEPIPKEAAEEYEVFATNFERVEAGERFAAADGEELTASEAFYPILLSAYGYAEVFGYAAEKVGVLE